MSDAVDVLIAGGGLSGTSLAAHLHHGGPPGLRIMVVDDGRRPLAQRSWAWWSDGQGLLDAAAARCFHTVQVNTADVRRRLPLRTYTYRVAEGRHLEDLVRRITSGGDRGQPLSGTTRFVRGRVESVEDPTRGPVRVTVDGRTVTARWVMDSVRPAVGAQTPPGWMSFTGWNVQTPTDTFPSDPILMDFRTAQGEDLRFLYVLPRSSREALVEHTCLSAAEPRVPPPPGSGRRPEDAGTPAGLPTPPARGEPAGGSPTGHPCATPAETALDTYLRGVLGTDHYRVTSSETGVLPLRPARHRRRLSPHVLAIGQVGGMVKASTGYAYGRIQRDSRAVARSLVHHGHPFCLPRPPARFRWLDAALLRVLASTPSVIEPAFARLFDEQCADQVLRFLDEDSTLVQEAQIMARMASGPFVRALLPLAAVRPAGRRP